MANVEWQVCFVLYCQVSLFPQEGISPISGGEELQTFLPTKRQGKVDVVFSKVGSNPYTLTNPFLPTVGVTSNTDPSVARRPPSRPQPN